MPKNRSPAPWKKVSQKSWEHVRDVTQVGKSHREARNLGDKPRKPNGHDFLKYAETGCVPGWMKIEKWARKGSPGQPRS